MARIALFAFASIVGLAACGPGPTYVVQGDPNSTLTIYNGSNYTIMYMYMSPTSQNTWGPDQLGSNVLAPGNSITLSGIHCDNWDIKLIDEDQDECILQAVPICAGDEGWHITNEALLRCEGY